jgi:hypothetical protein
VHGSKIKKEALKEERKNKRAVKSWEKRTRKL